MSRASVKTDVQRTAVMLDLLHRRYIDEYSHARPGVGPRYVVMEEVAPSTGGFSRLADVLVLDCWRSGSFHLSGWEIKASRADLKRELADPTKSLALQRYCDNWSLVVWDDAVHSGLTVPETWGLFVVDEEDGVHSLRRIRSAPRIKPEPWPRGFVASMVRNAFQQSPGAAYLGRSCSTSYREGVEAGESNKSTEVWTAIHKLSQHIYGEDAWRHRESSIETVVADAIVRIPSRENRIAAAIEGITGPVTKL